MHEEIVKFNFICIALFTENCHKDTLQSSKARNSKKRKHQT
uniref:Uncharacterized protein n=1 Tax=Anguilla anguilla TaxID=7936 RepID=A0A0E9XKJ2_ANGAN